MIKGNGYFAVIALLLINPAHGKRQSVTDAPLASRIKEACHFNADGSVDCRYTATVQILTAAGRDRVSRMDFSYPEEDTFTLVDASVRFPDEPAQPPMKAKVDIRMEPNPYLGFSRNKTTSLAFPHLRKHAVIRYTVKHHYAAVPYLPHVTRMLAFHPDAERLDAYQMTYTAERPLYYHAQLTDQFRVKTTRDKKKIEVTLVKPRYENYINELPNGYVRTIPYLQVGSSLSAQDNFGAMAKKYNLILQQPLPPDARRVIQSLQGRPAAAQVAEIMHYLHQRYRYLGDWRASNRGYVPFDLAQIEQNGYGDCKDLSILLTAMLREAGVQARPALVERGLYAMPLSIPGATANHAIVQAKIAGRIEWLDPTQYFYAPGYVASDLQDRAALVFTPEGKVIVDAIPVFSPRQEQRVEREEIFTAEGQSTIHERQVRMLGGELATLFQGDSDHGVESINLSLCNAVANENAQCRVERDPTRYQLPDVYRVNIHAEDHHALTRIADARYLYLGSPYPTEWDDFNRYQREGGLTDIYLGEPRKLLRRINLVGQGITAAIDACRLRSQWFDIDIAGEKTALGYRYSKQITIKTPWISHADIMQPAFQTLVTRASHCYDRLNFIVNAPGVQTVQP
ncbi:MAG: transglutaminase domain-containing protein [Sodalis sp. (in: enterobacteria)]|uniref:DUF3857 domain-containing protein n=1 Tax=Sodalis sp. (in: enterobacteria) TaxID=1898979 RepID=UPI0039E5E2E0